MVLVETFEGPFPEQKLRGRVRSELLDLETEGRFAVSSDGVPRLTIEVSADELHNFEAHDAKRIQFSGILEDGRHFDGCDFFANSVEYTAGMPTARWALAFGNVTVATVSVSDTSTPPGRRLRFNLINYSFRGEEGREIRTDAGVERRRDTFQFQAFARTWKVQQHLEFQARINALNEGKMRKCITAEILVQLDTDVDDQLLQKVLTEVDILDWLFSISSGSRVFVASWQLEDDAGAVLWTKYADRITPEYKGAWPTVDNAPEHGIRIADFIEKSYEVFSLEGRDLGLPLFVDWALQSLRTLPLELKVLSAILALEHLTAKYAIVRMGVPTEDLADRNVVEKLKLINRDLRFIPADLTGDRLRKHVRNPLVHTGQVLALTGEELDLLHRQLFNLGFQVFSRIVGYDGLYFNSANRFVPERVPAPR